MLNAKIEKLTKDRTLAQIESNRVAIEQRDAEVKRVVEAVRGDGAQDDTGRAVELACDEILRRLGDHRP
jgi:hypothetical protein